MEADPLAAVRSTIARFLDTEEGRDACTAANAIEKAMFEKSEALRSAIARYKPSGMVRGADKDQIEHAMYVLRTLSQEHDAFPELVEFFKT